MVTNDSWLANGPLFASIATIPSVSALAKQIGKERLLSLSQVPPGAQPFLAALLRYVFPDRPIVVVVEGLKAQESVHQDLQTWLRASPSATKSPQDQDTPGLVQHETTACPVLFFPAWEVLPHESKLPHADSD